MGVERAWNNGRLNDLAKRVEELGITVTALSAMGTQVAVHEAKLDQDRDELSDVKKWIGDVERRLERQMASGIADLKEDIAEVARMCRETKRAQEKDRENRQNEREEERKSKAALTMNRTTAFIAASGVVIAALIGAIVTLVASGNHP